MSWIDFEAEKPMPNDEIIADTKRHGVKMGRYMDYKIPTIWNGLKEMQFTHWMPKPKTSKSA